MRATPEPTTSWHGPALFFDATCGICRSSAERWRNTLERRGVAVLPLQSVDAKAGLHLGDQEIPDEINFLNGEQISGGADALIDIARRIWWARPLALLATVHGVRTLLRWIYRAIAARRHCLSGSCRISPRHSGRWTNYSLLLLLPALAFTVRSLLPDWAFMWTLAAVIFAGCKWLTWKEASGRSQISAGSSLAFLLGWVGMDAERFLADARNPARPTWAEWMVALSKTLLGVVLIWCVARSVPVDAPLIRGWFGLVGIVFVLHFGTFHLLALLWRLFGIDARPIMRSPLLATSLSDFWSRRWNLAFHQLAEREIFRPLLRRTNASFAFFATFLMSGVVHDIVISIPARGGYGKPTCYFLLQGLGVLAERSAFGKSLGLNRGWRGRAFAWLMTLAPVPLLFHEPFITRIILPFLEAIGAL
jgi:predicted DCC family thiol-disulfide oxidoreductase YuxK